MIDEIAKGIDRARKQQISRTREKKMKKRIACLSVVGRVSKDEIGRDLGQKRLYTGESPYRLHCCPPKHH